MWCPNDLACLNEIFKSCKYHWHQECHTQPYIYHKFSICDDCTVASIIPSFRQQLTNQISTVTASNTQQFNQPINHPSKIYLFGSEACVKKIMRHRNTRCFVWYPLAAISRCMEIIFCFCEAWHIFVKQRGYVAFVKTQPEHFLIGSSVYRLIWAQIDCNLISTASYYTWDWLFSGVPCLITIITVYWSTCQ